MHVQFRMSCTPTAKLDN